MSQPRQPTPSQSPTPSKSSLRRTSGGQNPSQRSLIPPPSPHFEQQPAAPVRYSPRSPPNQTLDYESEEDEEPLFQPEVSGQGDADSYFPYPEPERPFQPFFTLIEDNLTSEHHHPSVHYIFADDDHEIITEAALRSLETDDLGASSPTGHGPERSSQTVAAVQQDHHETRLPPPTAGVREHYLILDIHPQTNAPAHSHARGMQQLAPQSPTQQTTQSQSNPDFLASYAISSSISLSPDWQISTATITSAPTMGDTPSEDEGLMLRIEGRGIPPLDDFDLPGVDRAGKGRDSASTRTRDRDPDSLEEMIERFQSRLVDVRRLIEADGANYRDATQLAIGGVGGDGAGAGTGELEQGRGLEEQD